MPSVCVQSSEGCCSLVIKGCLDFENAAEVVEQGRSLIREVSESRLHFDVTHVENDHSVILSVLLRWLSDAASQGKEVIVLGLSGKMFELARVTGVDGVLPLPPRSS